MAQPVVQFLAMPWLDAAPPLTPPLTAARPGPAARPGHQRPAHQGQPDDLSWFSPMTPARIAGQGAIAAVDAGAQAFATATQPLATAAKVVSGDVRAVIETGLDTGKKLLLGEIILVALGFLVVGGVVWVYAGAPGASSGVSAVKRLLSSGAQK